MRRILAILFIFLPLSASAQSSKWYGTLDAESRHFRFEVTVNQLAGQTTGLLKSLDEGGRVFELSKMVWTGQERRFEIEVSKALFQGQLSDDGRQVQGVWKQRGAELKLTLQQRAEPPVEEYAAIWKGEIQVPFRTLPVAIRVKPNGDLYFDSLKEEAGGFLGTFAEKDGVVTFKVPAIRGAFEGKYTDDGAKLEGKWRQGLPRFTLNMVKATLDEIQAAPAPKRPQTPKPPFPYEIREVTVPVMSGAEQSHQLAGTLTVPSEGKSRAVVVLASGSGPQDRDESLLGHKPFWIIADHFGRNEIAVLRLDDRGVGKSTGDHRTATTADFADDIEAALEFLQKDAALKDVPTGIAGHSEGGLIAPLVAARNNKVAFVILLAGPAVNGEEIAYNQVKRLAATAGDSPEEVERKLKLNRALVQAMKANPGGDTEAIVEVIAEAAKRQLPQDLTEKQQQAFNETVEFGAKQVATPWFRFFATYEPGPTLRKLKCPVFALFGEKDIQVDPALHRKPMEDALKAAGNAQSVTRVFDGMNHLFQPCDTGGVEEYEAIETTMSPIVLQAMTDWIRRVTQR